MSFFLSHVAGNSWFDEGRYYCYNIQYRTLSDEDLFATDSSEPPSYRHDGILEPVENSDQETDPETVASWPNTGSNRVWKTNAIDHPRSRNECG